MNHCEYESFLSQYMDDQLDAQTAESLEQHLPLCPQCSRELDRIKALRQLCLDLPEEDIPAGLHGRILTRARSTDTRKSLGWVHRAVIPLAAAVLIFLLGRGIPDAINHKSRTAQDSGRAENMIMAVPEKGDTEAAKDMAEEDVKFTGSVEAPMAVEEAEPQNESIEEPANDDRADGIRTTGEKSEGSLQPAGVTAGEAAGAAGGADAELKLSGQFERPSYLRYGIIIALIVGFGFAVIRFLTRKK